MELRPEELGFAVIRLRCFTTAGWRLTTLELLKMMFHFSRAKFHYLGILGEFGGSSRHIHAGCVIEGWGLKNAGLAATMTRSGS